MKKLRDWFMGKSVKQRIVTIIIAIVLLVFLFFIIKANFIDIPTDTAEQDNRPQFRISIIDIGLLIVAVGAYLFHKYREKLRQRRM